MEMEGGSAKEFSPSRPRRSSTGSLENNENDDSSQGHQIMRNKSHSHKKIAVKKHFMSPTVSAASKAAPPRKKILAERNETSDHTHNHKLSHPETRTRISPRSSGNRSHSDRYPSQAISSYTRAYESDDDVDPNSVAESSLKAYDPSSNYLSPRPKYLRFNPNRRREILGRLEKEGMQDLGSSFESQKVGDEEGGSSGEDNKDSSFSSGKEIVEQSAKEGIETEIESVDDDYDEEEDGEVEEEERGWCLRGVLKVMLTLIACLLSTSYICSMHSPTPSPAQMAISNLKNGYLMVAKQTLQTISMKMHRSSFLAVEEGDNYNEVEEREIDEEDDSGIIVQNVETESFVSNFEVSEEKLVGNENEDDADKVDEAADIEGVRSGDLEFKSMGFEEVMMGRETDEIESFNLENKVEASHPDDDSNENIDNVEAAEDEAVQGSEVEFQTKSFDAKTDETEELMISYENEGQVEKVGWKNSNFAVAVLSVVSMILLPLAFICRSKKIRSTTFAEESEPELVPRKLVVAKKLVTPVLPKKKIEFSARLEDPNRHLGAQQNVELIGEDPNRHTGAPNVELIGEIVVGQMSSLRICDQKHEMFGSEKRNATFGALAQLALTPTKPFTLLTPSATDSPSYGSFTTAERKILKKEGGKSRDATVEVTPVRRSSRIRNRSAALSP